ncbi:MAG TPA: GNAT family N-acetyltransferase [Streptosporangiaceae bacterium]|jgi:GNAT superfamily N-acetyltransferase|nr:GNAT family N-acetyltransferase [Streptosporangiaceae bacterium]
MASVWDEPVLAARLPGSAEARQALTAYFRDIMGRYYGRPATDAEVRAAMAADPSDDLVPPAGLLLLAREGDEVVGCAGLLALPGGIGELRRVWVSKAARGRGVGTMLVRAVEELARGRKLSALRLDTRHELVEAHRLYAREGYREVAPFSQGGMADMWFEKRLDLEWPMKSP